MPAKPKSKTSPDTNKLILDELIVIKKLLILALYGQNYSSKEINKAVKMGASTIRGMFSKNNILIAQRGKKNGKAKAEEQE